MASLTREEFETQKADALRQWQWMRGRWERDPYIPTTALKMEATTFFHLHHRWRFNCFLCAIYNDYNGHLCKGCPLVSCFSDHTDEEGNYYPYAEIEMAQATNENVRTRVLTACDKIITALKSITYEEVPDGTSNDSDPSR